MQSVTLTKDEKVQVTNCVIAATKRRVPLVLGIGGNNTAEVTHQLKTTNVEGLDAILSVSPSYNKPNQEGIYQHFKAIADASPLPVILYNVPGQKQLCDWQMILKNLLALRKQAVIWSNVCVSLKINQKIFYSFLATII